MPPGQLVSKLVSKARRRGADRRARADDLAQTTFLKCGDSHVAHHSGLARILGPLDIPPFEAHRPVIEPLAERVMAHEFDLLGSGWTRVENTHGLEVTDANRAEAERIAALLPAGYVPIDWHIDFKSGHRWDPRVWYRDQPQVVGRGIDVKLPWELSRMQHLPLLAWRYGCAGAGTDAQRYRDEFRAQVIDFIAHNPPRFGINWNCAMDVGIRVAGWVMAFDLFRALGAGFDDAFEGVFVRSVREHAEHLVANLEWDESIRGNHYLADIAGLLIASAYLPVDETTDGYLHFAARELIAETLRQFHEDGSNFEASTSYHRLSAEMVVYALAVLQGVTPTRLPALIEERWHAHRPGEPSPALVVRNAGESPCVIPEAVIERVARVGRFTRDILDRHGRGPQIGDNDNGRFFKLLPATMRDDAGCLHEDPRNHRHLIDAVNGFFDENKGTDPVSSETHVVRAWLGGAAFPRPDLPAITDHAAYPGMGLYVYRHGQLTTIVRCGEVGQNGHGGHAHDDQLSFVMYADGEPVIIDPGTGCYTSDAGLRNRMRHYAQHNAIASDDGARRYAELERDGLFRMNDRARASVLGCSVAGFVGQHLLFGRPIRREFRCWQGELELVDQPQGLIGLRAVMHLAPGVELTRDSDGVLLRLNELTLSVSLSHDAPIEVEQGVSSEGYGAALVDIQRLTYRLSGAADCVCRISIMEQDA